MALCRFFARGVCKAGDSCKFIHSVPSSYEPAQSNKKILCHFYSRGLCRDGYLCKFSHEQDPDSDDESEVYHATSSATSSFEKPPGPVGQIPEICKYFLLGSCKRGDDCWYRHVRSDHLSSADILSQEGRPLKDSSDSRSRIPCKFASFPGGCQKDACPYLHPTNADGVDMAPGRFEASDHDEEGYEHEDNFLRQISGASIQYDEYGHVLKASFPTDFSLARITGLPPMATRKETGDILMTLGFELNANCIRMQTQSSLKTTATVKVEDSSFAKRLSAELLRKRTNLRAIPVPIEVSPTNCRKVYISWHKATRNVWINFKSEAIAKRVAGRFNDCRYRCLGQANSARPAQEHPSDEASDHAPNPPLTSAILLGNVPCDTTVADVERAIRYPNDTPREVKIGPVNYDACDAEVSVEVRCLMEQLGPLEIFHMNTENKGKRVKASALFQDEADARAATALNDKSLEILGSGKLTVTIVHSARVKLPTAVYTAWKARIKEESKLWKDQHLSFHTYPSVLSTVLKVEGNNAEDVVSARKILKKVSTGIVLTANTKPIWSPALNINTYAYQRLQCIEQELKVVLRRDRSKRQLSFFGPPEKIEMAKREVSVMLAEESLNYHEIELEPHLLSWMMQGGFKAIEQELGKNVAVFNPISRSLTINGTMHQYEEALTMMEGEQVLDALLTTKDEATPQESCPVCFCEPDRPIETSCEHVYCLECFEDYCKSAADTSEGQFKIKCQGERGICSTIFTLHELKQHLSSSVVESVLEASFTEYVKRHPQALRYCPTPDCGYVYRCTSDTKPPTYICPNCSEQVCTSCHSSHGEYTCTEHKDMNNTEALDNIKQEFDIKDCPKCKTPLEKIDGCNHMTCGGCRAHICWVCLAVFDNSDLCYDHMREEHGGIGLVAPPDAEDEEDEEGWEL